MFIEVLFFDEARPQFHLDDFATKHNCHILGSKAPQVNVDKQKDLQRVIFFIDFEAIA